MQGCWIWPITSDNLSILQKRGFDIMDFKKEDRAVRDVAPGDEVAIYEFGGFIRGIVRARSSYRRRATDSPIVWKEEQELRSIQFPFRIDCELVREGQARLGPLFDAMETPTDGQKGLGGSGIGAFLRGAALRSISARDLGLIGEALEGGDYTTTSPAKVAPTQGIPTPPRTAIDKGPASEGPPSRVSCRRRVFGAPLNFRELRHEPINEGGVIYLFGMVARELGFLVEGIAADFPDCHAKQRTKEGYYVPVRIEFEFKASNFRQHGHDPAHCDLIVCWENDWAGCPIDVIELKEKLQDLV